MKKQTAVEWFFNELQRMQYFIGNDILEALREAKAMEKEQVKDAVSHGWDNNESGKVRWLGEQYYNKTYGGEQ
jgi:hypothetical protein